jgi:hypothetical protein
VLSRGSEAVPAFFLPKNRIYRAYPLVEGKEAYFSKQFLRAIIEGVASLNRVIL